MAAVAAYEKYWQEPQFIHVNLGTPEDLDSTVDLRSGCYGTFEAHFGVSAWTQLNNETVHVRPQV